MATPPKMLIVGAMLYAYMFPPLLIAIPMFTIFARLGLSDTLTGLIASHLTLTLPLGVWFLWGFFKGMPFELEEAAEAGSTLHHDACAVSRTLKTAAAYSRQVAVCALNWRRPTVVTRRLASRVAAVGGTPARTCLGCRSGPSASPR